MKYHIDSMELSSHSGRRRIRSKATCSLTRLEDGRRFSVRLRPVTGWETGATVWIEDEVLYSALWEPDPTAW